MNSRWHCSTRQRQPDSSVYSMQRKVYYTETHLLELLFEFLIITLPRLVPLPFTDWLFRIAVLLWWTPGTLNVVCVCDNYLCLHWQCWDVTRMEQFVYRFKYTVLMNIKTTCNLEMNEAAKLWTQNWCHI